MYRFLMRSIEIHFFSKEEMNGQSGLNSLALPLKEQFPAGSYSVLQKLPNLTLSLFLIFVIILRICLLPIMSSAQPDTAYSLNFYQKKESWYFPLLLPMFVITSILYLIFVFGFAVDWSFWFIGFIFFAEIYRIFFSLLSLICAKTLAYPHFRPQKKNMTVDVLIPTLNEPRSVVGLTVEGATKIKGVNKVYLLDDGARFEMEQLAKEFGAVYLARHSSKHAKAGNMNFGLAHSKAEFIICLDADHVPQPNFIERTLGYFDDPKLAFVQTPQSFYNTTSIQHRPVKNYPLWNEQTMFYESIQPAKNAFNAAFFCGSSAILRREAVDSVGGFATGTATEDIHTSVRIHSKGWKSLFINERLAYGLAPDDLKEYHKQRVRWGAGSLGLLFRTKDSPVILPNLTIMQRLAYINSTLAFLQGHFKLFYYLLPIYIIFSPASFLRSSFVLYLSFYIPYLAMTFWITKVYSRNTYHPLYTEQYNIANIFSNIEALKGIYKVQKKFAVAIKIKRVKENSFVFFALLGLASMMGIAEVYALGTFIIVDHLNINRLISSSLFVGLFWNTANFAVFLTFLKFLYAYNRHDRQEKNKNQVHELMGTSSPFVPFPVQLN